MKIKRVEKIRQLQKKKQHKISREKVTGLVSDYLLVGLGNPGKEYEATRHNFGFLVATHFAKRFDIDLVRSAKYRGIIGSGLVGEVRVHILMPLTYMNLSGSAVKAFVKDKNILVNNLLVLCDDFHLDFGDLRIRPEGSAGGHNGLASVISELHSDHVPRLRLGIGAPSDPGEITDFVLSRFKSQEKKQLVEIIDRASDCCEVFLTSGMNKARDLFN